MSISRKIAGTLFLALCAFVLNRFRINIIFGVDFITGSIPVLIAAIIYDPAAGVVVAAAGSISTYHLWNHFYALPGFIAEAFFVGYFYKKKKWYIITLDIVYWFTIGISLVFLVYNFAGHLPMRSIEMIALKQAVNGVVNATVTILLLWLTRIIKPIKNFSYKPINTIGNIFFTFICSVIILALFSVLIFSSRTNEARFTEEIADRLERSMEAIDSEINLWADSYLNILEATTDPSKPTELPEINSVAYFDLNRKLIAEAPKNSDLSEFLPGVINDRNLSYYKTDAAGNPHVILSLKTDSEIIIAEMDFSTAVYSMMRHIENEAHRFLIIDEDSEIIKLSKNPENIISSQMYAEAKKLDADESFRLWHPTEDVANIERNRKSVFMDLRVVQLTGWKLLASESTAAMFNNIFLINTSYLKIISGFIILISISTYLLVRRIVGPLQQTSLIIDRLRKEPENSEKFKWPKTNITEIRAIDDYLDRLLASRQEYITEIQQSNKRLKMTLMAIGDGVIVTDPQNIIVIFNKIAADLTGWTKQEAIGASINDVLKLVHVEESSFPNAYNSDVVVSRRTEYILSSKNGQEYRISGTAAPIVNNNTLMGSIIVFHDETQRIRREQQLKQSQKMESIGILAGGIAHDFNNLLTGVISYADIIDSKLSEKDELKEYSGAILDTGEKAADLVQQLLSFARMGSFKNSEVDLHSLIEKTTHMFSASDKNGVKVELKLDADRSIIRGDEAMLHSMLLNLTVNARDAMPEGGTITISTERENIDRQFTAANPFQLIPGDYIKIQASDTGTGIPPEMLEQVFEPFFTTKEMGKGVGLGLASVYGTVVEMKGAISVESSCDVGTVFTIYLPLIKT